MPRADDLGGDVVDLDQRRLRPGRRDEGAHTLQPRSGTRPPVSSRKARCTVIRDTPRRNHQLVLGRQLAILAPRPIPMLVRMYVLHLLVERAGGVIGHDRSFRRSFPARFIALVHPLPPAGRTSRRRSISCGVPADDCLSPAAVPPTAARRQQGRRRGRSRDRSGPAAGPTKFTQHPHGVGHSSAKAWHPSNAISRSTKSWGRCRDGRGRCRPSPRAAGIENAERAAERRDAAGRLDGASSGALPVAAATWRRGRGRQSSPPVHPRHAGAARLVAVGDEHRARRGFARAAARQDRRSARSRRPARGLPSSADAAPRAGRRPAARPSPRPARRAPDRRHAAAARAAPPVRQSRRRRLRRRSPARRRDGACRHGTARTRRTRTGNRQPPVADGDGRRRPRRARSPCRSVHGRRSRATRLIHWPVRKLCRSEPQMPAASTPELHPARIGSAWRRRCPRPAGRRVRKAVPPSSRSSPVQPAR